MENGKIRFILGLLSAATLVLLIFFLPRIKESAILFISIPVFFIWVTFGLSAGLVFTLIACLSMAIVLKTDIFTPPTILTIGASFWGFRINKNFEGEKKQIELAKEKVAEEINVLKAQLDSTKKDNYRMLTSLERVARLENILADYSLTISEDDALDAIVRDTFDIFGEATRVLLYTLDTEKQELSLVRSRKRNAPYSVKAKKGEAFERLVLKRKNPILVEDVHTDFRFSSDEILEEECSSLIEAPLASEDKIIGVLRVDSTEKNKFTQSDLRLLDLVADLSAACLQNAYLYKKVEELAIHDGLTGLYVHRYFMERLESEVKQSTRSSADISLLMIDLDRFKEYNDMYGHSAGDLALKHVADSIRLFSEPGDIICRYGGEEFGMLMAKNKAAAKKTAEKIRKYISDTTIEIRRQKMRISVSIGIASCPSEEKSAQALIKSADGRLYKAKKNGRNKVCSG